MRLRHQFPLFIFLLLLSTSSRAANIANKKVAVVEAVFDSAIEDIQWLGSQYKTVICRTRNGGLYRSVDSGKTWVDLIPLLEKVNKNENIRVHSMHLHKKNPDIIMIMGKKHLHFISTDVGSSFRQIQHKGPIHGFVFHSTRPSWALMSHWTSGCNKGAQKPRTTKKEPCRHDLYVTKDFGASFEIVVSFVVQYSWGSPSMNQQDAIFFSVHHATAGDGFSYSGMPNRGVGWSNSIDFCYKPSPSSAIQRLVEKGNKFLISDQYIFVARLQDVKLQTVSLLISRDGGRSFKESKLPVQLQEKSYSVLDTSQDSVILHVNHGHPSHDGINVGNVYISDADGLRYSLSLSRNVRSATGESEFDNVASLEGIYIANFFDTSSNTPDTKGKGAFRNKLEEEEEEEDEDYEDDDALGTIETAVQKRHRLSKKSKDIPNVKTVISFDKGGMWSYLKPPTIDSRGVLIDCESDGATVRTKDKGRTDNDPLRSSPPINNADEHECFLHLHGISNYHRYAPFYSVKNAVGLIMGTGNVGTHLRFNEDEVNTYLSRDGGLTWAEVHKGAYIYEFGDHGGLIVMAHDTKATNQVVFSWNEGQSWYDFDLGNDLINIDNIVIEPNSSSVEFLLYGTRGAAGVIYHLDFAVLGQPMCKGSWAADSVASDYQTWTPSDGRTGDHCILGKKMVFTRRKPSSECFNGRDFARPVERKNCTCTERDYECEFGFTREINSFECVAEDPSLTQEGCVSSGMFYTDGYRKIPGDTCVEGWKPEKIQVLCPKTSPFTKRAKIFLCGTGLLLFLLILVSHFGDSTRVNSFLNNFGMPGFSTVQYTVLETNPHFSGNTNSDFYARPPRNHSTINSLQKDNLRDFLDKDDGRKIINSQQDIEDDENVPPLIEFGTGVASEGGTKSLSYGHMVNMGTTNDDDLFFMPSTHSEQRDPRLLNTSGGVSSFETETALQNTSSQSHPLPRLQPPPFSIQHHNGNQGF